MFGDGSFFDVRNSDNIRIGFSFDGVGLVSLTRHDVKARDAVRESRREIIEAFLGTTRLQNESGLLLRVPNPDVGNPSLPCPLFRVSGNGTLEMRNDVLRPSNWWEMFCLFVCLFGFALLLSVSFAKRVPGPFPPFDSTVPLCPALADGTTLVCSYTAMNRSFCPGTVELAFAKQSFLDPAQFGARIMCFDSNQRAYVNRYLPAPLTSGQIGMTLLVCCFFLLILFFSCDRRLQCRWCRCSHSGWCLDWVQVLSQVSQSQCGRSIVKKNKTNGFFQFEESESAASARACKRAATSR